MERVSDMNVEEVYLSWETKYCNQTTDTFEKLGLQKKIRQLSVLSMTFKSAKKKGASLKFVLFPNPLNTPVVRLAQAEQTLNLPGVSQDK